MEATQDEGIEAVDHDQRLQELIGARIKTEGPQRFCWVLAGQAGEAR